MIAEKYPDMDAQKNFLSDQACSAEDKLRYLIDRKIALSPECIAGFADVVFYRSLSTASRFHPLGFEYDYRSYLDLVKKYIDESAAYNDLDGDRKKEVATPVFEGKISVTLKYDDGFEKIQPLVNTAIMGLYRSFILNNNKKSKATTSDVERLTFLFSVSQILSGNAGRLTQYVLDSLADCTCYDLAVNTLNYHLIKNIDCPPLTFDAAKFSKIDLFSKF